MAARAASFLERVADCDSARLRTPPKACKAIYVLLSGD